MNKTLSITLGVASVVAMLVSAGTSAAVVKRTNTTIELTVTEQSDSDQFGGCAVRLASTAGAACNKIVSFDCTGEFNDKATAARMWDTALLAYALGQRVTVFSENTEKKSGAYCVVKRIDVSPAP
ncbi:MAG: hypothetical protein AAGI44_12515 [Pseudomonadota bacterium]